ncbi:MAG: hypothetical protein CMB47_04215 [Euryarchaeota archaeon]|nr:hypothetical protein [Euryarchaeota archaeon]|tara:strand:- start:535 stop:1020 length:486 start_codon:yes stop_codon:yes gene_type:complete
MRDVAILFVLLITTVSFAGCTQTTTGKIDASYCAQKYDTIEESELANNSLFEKCAKIDLMLKLNDQEVINGTSFVGLDVSKTDIIIIQINNTSSIVMEFNIQTNSNFNIISLNQSEYVKYVTDEEYEDIDNLSGTCLSNCSYEAELFADYYYLMLMLDEWN